MTASPLQGRCSRPCCGPSAPRPQRTPQCHRSSCSPPPTSPTQPQHCQQSANGVLYLHQVTRKGTMHQFRVPSQQVYERACNGSTVILIDTSMRELFLATQTGMARRCRGNADYCHYLRPEDSSICLHGLLQLAADLRHAQAALGVAQLVQALYGVGACVCRQVRLGSPRLALLSCSPHTHVRPHHVQILGVALHKLTLPTSG